MPEKRYIVWDYRQVCTNQRARFARSWTIDAHNFVNPFQQIVWEGYAKCKAEAVAKAEKAVPFDAVPRCEEHIETRMTIEWCQATGARPCTHPEHAVEVR